jgi:hypothetical protein
MDFLKALIRNLLFLSVIVIVMYIMFPHLMASISEVWTAVLGPIGLLVLVAFALPRRRRR